MLAALAAAGLGSACAGPGAARPPAPAATSPEAGREVLGRFTAAARAGRWPEAWGLLSARWRGALTPTQLGADWRGAGPVAREAAERVEALLAAGAALRPGAGGLCLAVSPGREARLALEAGGWRVDALE
ncbi:MAG: hypothetical protein IPO09_07365 [Anaeromyxobacter sp.]|nr:hypothetical protein [Anaeromyxobacter sp.]MBL0277928.1 hypothetical protein [Anaeromyxobacter sp.]